MKSKNGYLVIKSHFNPLKRTGKQITQQKCFPSFLRENIHVHIFAWIIENSSSSLSPSSLAPSSTTFIVLFQRLFKNTIAVLCLSEMPVIGSSCISGPFPGSLAILEFVGLGHLASSCHSGHTILEPIVASAWNRRLAGLLFLLVAISLFKPRKTYFFQAATPPPRTWSCWNDALGQGLVHLPLLCHKCFKRKTFALTKVLTKAGTYWIY